MPTRFPNNPILTKHDLKPSQPNWVIEGVLNPGAFRFDEKIWLLLRVAERPRQQAGKVSFPIFDQNGNLEIIEYKSDDPDLDYLSDPRVVTYKGINYLSTLSHLRLVCSDDGIHFEEPNDFPTILEGKGKNETFGIEDCRVSQIEDEYFLTYTQVSENGVGVGLMRTKNWRDFQREGMIIPPHNKDCAIFEEKVSGQYWCLHRPSGQGFGGNFIWIASSPDAIHWGKHHCLLRTRKGMWDSARVGAGAAPIKTEKGWLEIYHGADFNHRYCLGAVLLDLDDPTKVIARSNEPIMTPDAAYEQEGFFGNVVFTNGHVVNGDEIILYYGASDEVICGARLSISTILDQLKT